MRKMHDNIRLYHVDHLGSTSLVTDIDGEITQHVAYIPYGEVFVEQRNGSWNTPYLFNAKELDEETGLYYYGARYLDPTHAAWLSVDPLFEKYVGMSPYNYCMGNPVGLVDVDGMGFTDASEGMAQQEEKYAEKRIDENWTKLEQRGERNFFISKIKNNRLKDEIVRYTLALEEIQEMRESDMIFDFKTYRKKDYEDIDKLGNTYTRGSRGYISYDPDKNVCTIHVNEEGGLCLGDFAHELKHGYQFLVGRLSLKVNPNGGETNIAGFLYDYTDELEAHERGFDFGSQLSRVPSANVYGNHPEEDRFINIRLYNQWLIARERNKNNKNFYDIIENDVFCIFRRQY